MKKLLILLGCLPTILLAQQPGKDGFRIQGTVHGLPDKSAVYLTDVNNATDTVSRSTVQKGKFVLTGTVKEANLYQLTFAGVEKKTVLFMGNDDMQLSGDTSDLPEVEVKGSASNSDFTEFRNVFNPLFQKLRELTLIARSTPDFQSNDSLMKVYRGQIEKISTAIDQFVFNKKSSPVSPFLLVVTSEVENDVALLEKRFNTLDPAVQQGFYGKILQEEVAHDKIGAVGSEAINFTQTDTSGAPVSLSDFRGKYVLLDFWASWCRPCRAENPNVVAAYNKFKDKNFTVLSVSLDRARDPWIKAIQEDHLTWTHVSDLKFWQNAVARQYNVEGIPQNYLIDPQGKIVGKNLRGEALIAKLCNLLGCD